MQFRAAEEDCRQAGPVGVACEMGARTGHLVGSMLGEVMGHEETQEGKWR